MSDYKGSTIFVTGGAGFIDANPDGMDPKLAAMADGAQKAADAYDRDHPDADDR